ncbi:MAG: peptidylprolyl isomerase [Bacteroidales bacterium]|nr:peptidylprolyl isomerase [Bacteroidales bacterium]
MKRILIVLALLTVNLPTFTQSQYSKVVIETTAGKLVFMLYDNTPLHSKNFTKLINEGYYNNVLFHRVIKNFMIQAGDPASKKAKPGEMLGSGDPGYTIPAEFAPEYYHKKGALAAARAGDHINPNKESSGSQFYIVKGQVFDDSQLDRLVELQKHVPFTEEQRKTYTTLGGTPHLDYAYTVFGELVEGMEVLENISLVATDQRDRPLEDIKIIKTYILK